MNKSNADLVLEAMQDMHGMEQVCTRETLARETGLKLSIVDDRVGHLIDNGLAYRVQRGVFVPAHTHAPARPVSRTLLPDGTSVLEIGDHVLHLTPREARMVGEQMAGAGHQYAAIALGHQAERLAGEITRQLAGLKKRRSRVSSAESKRDKQAQPETAE